MALGLMREGGREEGRDTTKYTNMAHFLVGS